MKSIVRPICVLLLLVHQNIWAREGMTIDKLECSGNAAMCSTTHCSLTMAANDPFVSVISFDCNMTRVCSSIYVRVKNWVKLKSTYNLSFEVKLDVCAITSGAKHPVIQTFLGTNIYENLERQQVLCPWGPNVFRVANFSVDGSKRGSFGLKKTGRYRLDLEFTCGQNSQLFTMKFYGKRSLTIADD